LHWQYHDIEGAPVNTQIQLVVIIILLVWILMKVISIAARLKERLPTEKEQDYKWLQDDPMEHWQAHKNDEQSK
jgi:cell division protein FtsN